MNKINELLITPVYYCEGTTKIGKRCSSIVTYNSKYCPNHAKLFKYPKPEEDCPVCMESLSDVNQPLSCGHWIHRNCVIKWGKDKCPVCRSNIKLTKKEQDLLSKKEESADDTSSDFDHQAIIDLIRQDMQERGISEENMFVYEIDDSLDFLSSLVVNQVLENLNQVLVSSSITTTPFSRIPLV